ncbi:hypothetical protein [Pontibacter burrus]|uniref:Uncharacterized protein n=1 Tax=Pontibacter burrus TaxID=2704466 RepID=A0A6B3LRQ9_9BACT|nr:hypothetical protein [Pontibacter burrus]NEM96181.1 hypothetical protein [Pontibacter burrus]
MRRTLEVTVTYSYTLEVDDENHIVKEYESDEHLVKDMALYRFGTGLPVIGDGGVLVGDVEVLEVEIN